MLFTLKKLLLGLAGIVVIFLVGIFWFSWGLLNSPLKSPQDPDLMSVHPGMSLSSIALQMAQQRIIDNALVFSSYVRLIDKGGSIKAGEYQFRVGQNELEILDQLVTGDVVQHEFTFVEGWTFFHNHLSDHL